MIDQIHFLLEKKRKRPTTTKSKIDSKSKENRKDRAKNVKITNHEITDPRSKGRYERQTCNAESAEKSESTKHTCQVQMVTQSGKIDFVNCSCSDFQSRYQYHRNKEGISEYNEVTPIKDIFNPHTQKEPTVTNPDNDGYMCKHLIAFVDKIKSDEQETT